MIEDMMKIVLCVYVRNCLGILVISCEFPPSKTCHVTAPDHNRQWHRHDFPGTGGPGVKCPSEQHPDISKGHFVTYYIYIYMYIDIDIYIYTY